jgi:antitoxin MazE
MKAKIVRIGNSRGIRIPKPLIEETGLDEEVEIHADGSRLIIAPVDRPRADWSAQFRKMAQTGDDALVDGGVQTGTAWDEDEWEWE